MRRPDGTGADSTRDLIRAVGWAATGLVALRAGEYVASKRECHLAYARAIGDKWSTLLRDIYEHCRGEWAYLVPDAAADRALLRAICARTLGFENHFLTIYRRYVARELAQPDEEAALAALSALVAAPLRDPDVTRALQTLARDGTSATLREAAHVAIDRLAGA